MSAMIAVDRARLRALFEVTRGRTEQLAARLSPEDQQLQSMPDASPTKWHRAHTTWFFETFVLAPAGVAPFDARYAYLFNSYYEAAGPRHSRPKRGVLSRPTADEVGAYRRAIDARIVHLFATADESLMARLAPVVEIGINHEEQHQELILTDILHAFSESPLHPAYLPEPAPRSVAGTSTSIRFVPFDGGVREIGAAPEGDGGAFAFDNERPRHKEWLDPFAIADRLVNVGELKAFVRDGGYRTPSLWLSEGYDVVRANGIEAPMHSRIEDGALIVFGFTGDRIAADDEPVSHVSYYEADAIARYLGARLPSEVEWEVVAARADVSGNFVDDGVFRPLAPTQPGPGAVRQLFGDVWEWTRSSYEAYPGFEPPAGALGEYNGKFMVNQRVLRGGSCLTPRRHVRATYRNFWPAGTRFQMTGVRLAKGAA